MEQKRVRSGKTEVVPRVRQDARKAAAAVPRRIKIGYLNVEVQSSDKDVLSSFNRYDEVVYGRYEERTGVITLSTEGHPAVVRETLLHEILHAIIRQSAMSVESDEEERIVRHLSGPLYATLLQNPQLVKYLTESQAP